MHLGRCSGQSVWQGCMLSSNTQPQSCWTVSTLLSPLPVTTARLTPAACPPCEHCLPLQSTSSSSSEVTGVRPVLWTASSLTSATQQRTSFTWAQGRRYGWWHALGHIAVRLLAAESASAASSRQQSAVSQEPDSPRWPSASWCSIFAHGGQKRQV